MKTMSQVAHLADCPETLDEARALLKAIAIEVDALRGDKKRLDWLEANSADVYEIHGRWYVYPDKEHAAPGIRAAIDAAKT